MAAIDLERGLEHGGRVWGKERPELMDNFDSEMQEWEDQLQDIQRKIEELYNEVQARRGANDVAADRQKNGDEELECGRGRRDDHHGDNDPGAAAVSHHYSNGCNYSPNGYSRPVSHQRGYGYRHTNGVPEIGDLLQDYLGQGKKTRRKTNGARHVHFSDTVKLSSDVSAYQDEIRSSSGNERLGQEQFLGSLEDNENRKNQVSHTKGSARRESSPNKENTGSKPPLGQREAPSVQPRSQPPITAAESPAVDRKSFSPLGDRMCNSPSVLRKFGAMLQENEGKMLTESGVVTHQGPPSEPKSPTPGCQRRALGAAAAAGRAPVRVPTQKCPSDSDVLTAEIEPGQEWGLDSGRQTHKDHRGGNSGSKGSQRSPQQSQGRSQVAGSPKIRSRANSGAERERGLAPGERARKPAPQHVEPKMDHRVSNAPSGAQRVQRGGLVAQGLPGCGPVGDEGLIELLDMLDIQHEYSSSPRTGHRAHRQDPQQVNPADASPANLNKNFSRPARPANQRPPSRWACRAPTARTTPPSGPVCPLARPPSPMTRTPSPALRQRPVISYSLQTETVIM